MLTVFWDSTSDTIVIVFWMMLMGLVNPPARWWPCACLKRVYGLRRLKKLELFEMLTSLRPGAHILFRHKWRKLTKASFFYLIVLMNIVGSVIGNKLFSSVFLVLDWNFVVLQCHGTFAIGIRNWFDHDWVVFVSFLLEFASFRQFHICVDWTLHEFLNYYSFFLFGDIKFLR